jgi:hypothetical protein
MRRGLLVVSAFVVLSGAAVGGASAAKHPSWTKNCTALNARYHHGVGKVGARDHTSETPVTTFKRSNLIYATAMTHNRGLDRDKDGIACEQA